jgi:HK97 family phage portal protein
MIATLDTSNARVKSVPLSSLTREFFESLEGGAPEGELSALRAQQVVPWVYRAVDLRANAVADMPFGLYQTNDAPLDESEARAITALLKSLLYLTEAALCVYGAAYWVKEENRAGLNVTPRWVVPSSMTPQYDAARGVIGFERRVASAAIPLSLDEVVYFWIPSLTSELGAGIAPAQAALRSANLLNYLDSFASGFFQRGAVKATLLTVQGTAQPAEMERLERWWNRLLAGVKNAWRSVAIRADVKPVVIGSDISEASAPELKNAAREDVATAFGIPQTLLMSNAANYATAVNDVLVFTLWTVLPECRRIQETLNAQMFDELGLRFEFEPKRLEQMQQYELQKAQSVQALTGGAAILDVDEARALLGYAPKQTTANANADASAANEAGDDVAQDLKRWERKALNRVRAGKCAECDFMSDVLPQSMADTVRAQLAFANDADAVKAIFANAARQGGARNGDTVDAFFRAHNDQKRGRSDAAVLRAAAKTDS